jgi:lipopolysaccharide export system protein LptA
MRCKTILFLLLLFPLLSFAQPITGEADKLEFKKDRIIYHGNARLTRGETILKADRVTIFIGEDGKPRKLIAEGNVRYSEPQRKASADYAEYVFGREIIILRGRARVEEEKNVLEADEIVYDRKNETLSARGKNRKVRTIYIEEEGK